MSKLTSIKKHIHSVSEINNIFNAMKSLSVVELSKAMSLLKNYLEMLNVYNNVLCDFSSFYPQKDTRSVNFDKIYVLVGSERGFCGGFNEKIIKFYQGKETIDKTSKCIIIGRKLEGKLLDQLSPEEVIESLSVVEDLPRIMNKMKELMDRYLAKEYIFITNKQSDGEFKTVQTKISRDFDNKNLLVENFLPPELYLSPHEFFENVIEQYIDVKIANVLIESFYTENKERLRHMESASDKIETKLSQLNLKKNSLRQFEITQELENILLNAVTR
ncbi:F0F1 ATP synthase subunit gamma [Halobacteriovorax sp. GFR7]|uniref:F0F1 ATP synthase subunit gamma n=1 Tax=unclassified Halobacteriovorax TaxID=2639665 RepID=UPI003D965558